MGRMSEQVRLNNNQFWESARRLHLDGLLASIYEEPRRRRLVRKWLNKERCKRVLIRQMDFDSDPLLIEFREEGFEIGVFEEGEPPPSEVEVIAAHAAIIAYSTDLLPFIFSWLRREIRMPRLFNHARDHWFVFRVFLLKL